MRGFTHAISFFISLTSISIFASPGPESSAVSEICESSLNSRRPTGAENEWLKKTVILDTNVILNDPEAMYRYPGAHIIISGTVLEELDAKKSDPRLGKAVRSFTRELLRVVELAQSSSEVSLGRGSLLTVDHKNYAEFLAATTLDLKKKDNEILALAKAYSEERGRENVFIISDDLNVRIKSFGLMLQARPYELTWLKPAQEEIFEGVHEFELSDEQMEMFLKGRMIRKPEGLNIAPNEFVAFKSPSHPPTEKTVGRFRFNRESPDSLFIYDLMDYQDMGLPGAPMNLEQMMLLDLLLDPHVDCVIAIGKAGTGKTFLAMMAALELMQQQHIYDQIFVTKPTVYMGHNNPGALPGDIEGKYSEWMKPYLDNLAIIQNLRQGITTASAPKAQSGKGREAGKSGPDRKPLMKLPFGFNILPFEFLRGRSLSRAMVVMDEFQNTNLHEAKTTLTRVGGNTKIVIMGDPTQIDVSPNFLNSSNNGLSVSAAIFTGSGLSMDERSRTGLVRLHAGVRSGFAELATKVFEQPTPLD